jgi:hypothetical protein
MFNGEACPIGLLPLRMMKASKLSYFLIGRLIILGDRNTSKIGEKRLQILFFIPQAELDANVVAVGSDSHTLSITGKLMCLCWRYCLTVLHPARRDIQI